MDHVFWRRKWRTSDTAFNQGEANPLLTGYFKESFPAGAGRVFLPLCGKTRDIHWLLDEGYQVVGSELSALAVDQLFDELALEPEKTACGDLYRYSAKGVDVFVGDIFKLSRVALEKVDVVYDRAALVALPEEIRGRYAAHLIEITHAAPQFLICYEYDQSLMEGPPFSIGGDELNRRYGKTYDLTLIENADAPGGLKGECAAKETAWSLKKK